MLINKNHMTQSLFGREEVGLRAMYITTEAYLKERRGERDRHVWEEGLKGRSISQGVRTTAPSKAPAQG